MSLNLFIPIPIVISNPIVIPITITIFLIMCQFHSAFNNLFDPISGVFQHLIELFHNALLAKEQVVINNELILVTRLGLSKHVAINPLSEAYNLITNVVELLLQQQILLD